MDDITHILETTRTVAIVGMSDNPERASHEVAHYLQAGGYRIIPVNPVAMKAAATSIVEKAARPIQMVVLKGWKTSALATWIQGRIVLTSCTRT